MPGLTVMALAAGVHKITMPVSAGAPHSLANARKTRNEMVEDMPVVRA